MQLTMEVLPAPLGPMMENSSPSRTPKLTSVSARTPPNRRDTPRASRISSTKIPPGSGALKALFIQHRSLEPILYRFAAAGRRFVFWLPRRLPPQAADPDLLG